MDDDEFNSGASDWAHIISKAIWNSDLTPACTEHEYYPENPQWDFVNWFVGDPCYAKLKQH